MCSQVCKVAGLDFCTDLFQDILLVKQIFCLQIILFSLFKVPCDIHPLHSLCSPSSDELSLVFRNEEGRNEKKQTDVHEFKDKEH